MPLPVNTHQQSTSQISSPLNEGFSGSFSPLDITFLLKIVTLEPMSIESREARIQSGEGHYSEMIGPEEPPEPQYLDIFKRSFERNCKRLARDCLALAAMLSGAVPNDPIALISIPRSGTPIGVMVAKILKDILKRKVNHYGISIIRDRGIDLNALKYVLERHPESQIIFLDGWTGKGVIASELKNSIQKFNQQTRYSLSGALAVLSDPAGKADLAVSADDWLIPTSLLNSVVSGLISRTILNDDLIGPHDFHGCLFYPELAPFDLSQQIVNSISALASEAYARDPAIIFFSPVDPQILNEAQKQNTLFMEKLSREFKITNLNYIKPGLGEATRVLMRRAPEILMVKDFSDPDLEHALFLAHKRRVPVRLEPNLPYRAAAVIKQLY
ncbi:MAG: cysteine protease StiP family protein [Deltaproteobacteria bacterium]|jgi:hypothetical protein|nr:cysteine protease StiP family protein [Deltaproteobacteria bacterium]